jgi:AbrB family looped-hinge helix DNA binding protein
MKMSQVVSITSQGQLTIPKSLRDAFGIQEAVKAVIEKQGDVIVVKPKKDFWSLKGSLATKVKLSDKELKKARSTFAQNWAKNE